MRRSNLAGPKKKVYGGRVEQTAHNQEQSEIDPLLLRQWQYSVEELRVLFERVRSNP